MKRFKEYFTERKQVGDLYHFTDVNKISQILYKDELEDINDRGYISFTRDKRMPSTTNEPWWTIKTVRITVDGDKLSDKYKIQPYNDNVNNTETEERIVGKSLVKIPIKKVEVLKHWEKHLMNNMGHLEYIGIPPDVTDDEDELQELFDYIDGELDDIRPKYVNKW